MPSLLLGDALVHLATPQTIQTVPFKIENVPLP